MENSYVKRWLTGLILAAIILGIIVYASSFILTMVIALFCVGGIWEYNNIVLGKGCLKEKIEGIVYAALIPFMMYLGDCQTIIAFLAVCILITFIVLLSSAKEKAPDMMNAAKVISGMMYIPFLMSHFVLLRKLDNGVYWVMFVLVLALSGDIAALYIGKYWGRRKLIPLVSPGKTVEGTIALIITSTVSCLIFSYLFFPYLFIIKVGVLAFIGSIIGQLGDLSESAIKRNYGRKDASSLLPGHGGLLDRMDCLIFIAPFVYYYKIYVIG